MLIVEGKAQEVLILVSDCKDEQLRGEVVTILLYQKWVCCNHIHPIYQKTLDEIFARVDLEPCDGSDLRKVRVRAIFEYQLE